MRVKKLKSCPRCGSENLSDRWSGPGRKLRQFCRDEDCTWIGEPREPEKRRIHSTKTLYDNNGYCYEGFDRYGHPLCYSQSYASLAAAEKAARKFLVDENRAGHAGPVTAVVWPGAAVMKGKVIR